MRVIRNWWYSLIIGMAYLGVFHLWMRLEAPFILISAIVALVPLGLLFTLAQKRGYFINCWDALIHASVLLDIFLEGALIPYHDTYGFYGCAVAFAAVIVGYRKFIARSLSAPAQGSFGNFRTSL